MFIAKDKKTLPHISGWQAMPYSPHFKLQKGDLLIFGNYSPLDHLSGFLSTNECMVMDQNYANQSMNCVLGSLNAFFKYSPYFTFWRKTTKEYTPSKWAEPVPLP